jgi:tetratricopeptide (TPR) repeat protein
MADTPSGAGDDPSEANGKQEPFRDERFYRSPEWQFYVLWLRGQGHHAEARQVCEEALQFDRTPLALCSLGDALLFEGRADDAANAFGVAVALEPDFDVGYNGLGQALVAAGRFDEAIYVLTRLTQIKPDWPSPFHHLGTAYRKQGDLASAIRSYRDGVAVLAYTEILACLGEALVEAGQTADALETLKRAAMEYPHAPEVHLALGKALLAAERTEEARRSWQRVLDIVRGYREDSILSDEDVLLETQTRELMATSPG